jgi:hypothetical protein
MVKRIFFQMNVVIFCTFCAGGLAFSQHLAETKNFKDLASMRLENVQIEAQSLEGLFSALSNIYDIPLGLEVAREDDEFVVYKLTHEEATLTDLMNQFVKENDNYTWQIQDGVLHVFPVTGGRDDVLNKLLGTKLRTFSLAENTNCFDFANLLITSPELKKLLTDNKVKPAGMNFSGMYIPQLGQKFKFRVFDTSVRSVLDKVVKESPVARTWIIKRYTSDNKLSIRVKAQFENTNLDNDL